MSTAANYASIPRAAQAQVSTANTARDGSGALATVFTGAANGSRIDDVTLVAAGTTTAGMVRLFVSFDGGATRRLLREVPVSAVTPSGTVPAWTSALANLSLTLPNTSAVLYASTHNAEAINVIVTRAGDF